MIRPSATPTHSHRKGDRLTSARTSGQTGKTERQKLPLSGTPHPTATRFFYARIPSGAYPCPISMSGGGGNKPERVNTVRRLKALLNLPAPLSLGRFNSENLEVATMPNSTAPNSGNLSKASPLPFADADRLDREVNRLAGELAELAADVVVRLVYVTGDRRLRAVHARLAAAFRALDAAKAPARELWVEADAARAAGGAQ